MSKEYSTPTPTVATPIEAKRERPFALKVVCALLMFEGLLLLLVSIGIAYQIYGPNTAVGIPQLFSGILGSLGVITEMLVLGIGGAVMVWVAVGLWRFSPWAWRWTMITIGVLLIINLWNYFGDSEGRASTFALIIDVAIVFYLVQPEVRRLYIDKPKIDTHPHPL